jgi:hypothetical protein
MRARNRLSIVLVVALVAMLFSASAGAGVERYQFTDYTINVTSVNGYTAYAHDFWIRHNPCDDSYTAYGYDHYHDWYETVTMLVVTDTAVKMRSTYPNGYSWYPSFTLNGDGTLTFIDGYGPDNVNAATGSWSMSQTDYNHGQYVAEHIAEYEDAPHSCIGMPIVSQGKTR